MLHDLRVTAAQAARMGEWVNFAPDAADVELRLDGGLLLVSQGDDMIVFDAAGEDFVAGLQEQWLARPRIVRWAISRAADIRHWRDSKRWR